MECMRNSYVKDQVLDGRFRCIAPLNHGSFGMVFLAEDIATQQQVAIKCLIKPNVAPTTPSMLAADEGVEELACHATLQYHDHLVNLLHHVETDAHTYLVLEYCSQGDLYEAIRLGRGPLETEHVRDFMLQLVGAIEHMHSRGLYHRDIKPENIFIMQDGSMKLGDFGLATRSLWCYESCVGSDRYMAPEQYDPAGNGYSPGKADIWSIGICLLNILFSRNPFVTPTDSDVLFADYRRDRQSLFDVFPNMSQDTFEVLNIAMAIDPKKRELSALRQAILRVVSFTVDDESLDEFCTEERDIVRASANREPLRTPSIQSPQINAGDSFPWAKALHASPGKQVRQLSAIPDTEIYDEDLFPPSENGHHLGESWFSVHQNTPSLASVLDSGFGGSFKSMAIRRPEKHNPPRPDPVPISGSLPVQASRPIPTMSMVFGKKKDTVAKSWSDLWDEDEEESEQEELAFKERHAQKSRRWSDESQPELTVRPGVLTEAKIHSSNNVQRSPEPKTWPRQKQIGSPNENEPFGFRGHYHKYSADKGTDKWAALGNKRRNFQPPKETQPSGVTKRRSMTMGWRKEGNNGQRDTRGGRPPWLDENWRRDQYTLSQHKRSSDGYTDEDDSEWVGVFNLHL
jgi:serine/threonine protein kinase